MTARSNNSGKRSRIIEAAAKLFGDSHKVRKVSIEEIAAEARVSPTTIYHYFGTRDALVAEVAKSLVRTVTNRSREFLNSSMPWAQKLQAIASVKLQLTSAFSNEVMGKMVSQDPALAKFVDDVVSTEFAPLWRQFLAEGKAEGYINPGLNEGVFMSYMEVLIAGFRTRPDLVQEWQKSRRLLEEISRLIFFGFMEKDVDLFGNDDQNHRRGISDQESTAARS